MNWTHYNPVRIIAGVGINKELGKHLPSGEFLLLTSSGMLRRGTADELTQAYPAARWAVRTIAANPELEMLDALADALRATDYKAIVALGGGSVMDAAKVLSVLLPTTGKTVLDKWLRGSSSKATLSKAIPVYCLPTTAGTGAEVTPFATVWDTRGKRKHSLEGAQLYPQTALLDPSLTLALPWRETLYSALDALSHSLETLWNRHATPVSTTFAVRALNMILSSLPRVENDLNDLGAREQLQEASLLAGLSISQSRTALAHSISYPLTVRYRVPHGLACSFMLSSLIEWVRKEKAWMTDVDAMALGKAVVMLKGYALCEHIKQYCTPSEVISCCDEMMTSERAANFSIPVNKDALIRLIKEIMQ